MYMKGHTKCVRELYHMSRTIPAPSFLGIIIKSTDLLNRVKFMIHIPSRIQSEAQQVRPQLASCKIQLTCIIFENVVSAIRIPQITHLTALHRAY